MKFVQNLTNFLKKTFILNEIERITRLSVLDGFRGLLAISVVIQHTIGIFNMSGDYKWFNLLGTYVGVPSFFVLSSFLLTYKLYEQIILVTKQVILSYYYKNFKKLYTFILL